MSLGHDVEPTGPRTRRRPTRAQTRQRVLDAAFTVFGEYGIQRSSLEAVAEAGRLTKGAIYSSFPSKNDLVVALVQENALHRVELGLEEVLKVSNPRDALTVLGNSLTRASRRDQVSHRLVTELYVLAHQDATLAAVLRESRRRARIAGAEALEQTAAALDFPLPMPADQLIVLLLALSNGLAVEWGIDDESVPDHLFASVLVSALLDSGSDAVARSAAGPASRPADGP